VRILEGGGLIHHPQFATNPLAPRGVLFIGAGGGGWAIRRDGSEGRAEFTLALQSLPR